MGLVGHLVTFGAIYQPKTLRYLDFKTIHQTKSNTYIDIRSI